MGIGGKDIYLQEVYSDYVYYNLEIKKLYVKGRW